MLKTLLRHSSIYLVGDLIRRSISVFLLPFYTRYLTPSDYGLLELLDLAITATVLLLGLSAAGEAMIRVYYEKDNEPQRNAVISSVLWIVLLIGTATSVLGAWAATPLSTILFHGASSELIRLAFFAMFFGCLCEVLMLYQQLKRRPMIFVGCSVLQTLATIGLNVYFIAYRHMGVWGFVCSKCIVLSIASSVLLFLTVREVSWHFHRATAHEIVRFGLPLIVGGLATFTIHFSDRFFITRSCTLAELGVYALAYKIGMLVSVLVGAPFNAVWNVTCYAELANPSWRSQFARAFKYLALVSAFGAVGLSLFARPILHLAVPTQYFGAIALVPVIAAAYAIRTLGDFFPSILFIKKQSRLMSGLCGACATVNLGCNLMLIPRFGIQGAAWATLITWLTYFGLCWHFAHRTTPLPIRLRPLLTIAVLTLAILILNSWATMSWLVAQWSFAGSTVVVFSAALIFCGGLTRAERERLIGYVEPMRQTFLSACGLSTVRAR
jgi:O-antigen/teichoic acid export membrane protein